MSETFGVVRCWSCVLPRSEKGIAFDADGSCALCHEAREASEERQPAASAGGDIEKHISTIRELGRGRAYDCLVGLSGGRDSSYLLYLLTRKHGLRCLAAYYRTPFTPDEIDGNVRRLTSRLGVPLIEMDISRDHHRKIAGEMVRTWLESPDPGVTNLACAPCKLVNREIFRIARANGVRVIVFGGNQYETFQLGAGQFRDNTAGTQADARPQHSFGRQTRKMMMVIRRGIDTLRKHPVLWKHMGLGFKASVLYINPHTPYLQLRYRDIYMIDYFHHAPWNEAEADAVLEETGWELPKNCTSRWRADCMFGELKNYMFAKMTGVTYMDAYLSNMVRAGILDRERALQRLATEGQPSEARLAEVCKALEIPRSAFPQ